MEKGLRDEDVFDEVVARAQIVDLVGAVTLGGLTRAAAQHLSVTVGVSCSELEIALQGEVERGVIPVSGGIGLLHLRSVAVEPVVLLIRCAGGVEVPEEVDRDARLLRGVVVLVSVRGDAGRHLRHLGHLATQIHDPAFAAGWLGARDDAELRETLLRRERSLTLHMGVDDGTEAWVGQPLHSVLMPRNALVAFVARNGDEIVPNGSTELEVGDRVTIIGSVVAIRGLRARFTPSRGVAAARGGPAR
jgi:hypothetical protein